MQPFWSATRVLMCWLSESQPLWHWLEEVANQVGMKLMDAHTMLKEAKTGLQRLHDDRKQVCRIQYPFCLILRASIKSSSSAIGAKAQLRRSS